MRISNLNSKRTAKVFSCAALFCFLTLSSADAFSQMTMPPPQSDTATQPQDTQAQITQLKQQVAQLQAALRQGKTGKAPGTSNAMPPAKSSMGMGMGDGVGEMGGMSGGAAKPPMAPMKDDGGEMSAMPAPGGGMGASAKPMGGAGCCGMSMGKPMAKPSGMGAGKMGGMSGGGTAPQKAMPMSDPTLAGASPLLHVGAKDFFLDHAKHLVLTVPQTNSLGQIKATAIQQKAASQTQIDTAQQDLWQLTSANQPDAAGIDSKVQQIAKLEADQQIAFIHSVASASDILTPEQRMAAMQAMPSPSGSKSQMPKAPMKSPMKM